MGRLTLKHMQTILKHTLPIKKNYINKLDQFGCSKDLIMLLRFNCKKQNCTIPMPL